MEDKITMKKTRWFISGRKEKLWLEEMAQQGWFFTNITWSGIRYTFEQGEPKKMVYEVDRFDLPKSPSLSEIQAKKEFFELAEEMGWQEVTHDVDMNYYFSKEWEEDGVNELYETHEMRKIHGDKYYHHFVEQAKGLNWLSLFLGVIWMITGVIGGGKADLFGLGYLMFVIGYSMMMEYFGRLWKSELSISAEEWRKQQEHRSRCKEVKRFFLSSKSLERYLVKMSREGWHVTQITNNRYYFEKGEPEEREYVIDSKNSVMNRLSKALRKEYEDGKDIMMQNQDWQYQSVEDAKALGWNYLCASGNLLILYTREEKPQEEEVLATKSCCLHPWLLFYAGCFLAGFVIGFIILAL